ncbi:cell division protein ZapA [Salsuginibacillus kocurii]|uniref:cell division protein ZapA n=1 Tax=Salsuginibacillus kocurii TaxID=427078 RepID=UPI0003791E93|nr:cell division protein ZapA [Salsuginibacillus kocurii]
MAEGKEKSRTTVSIYGQNYTIVGDESKNHVHDIANRVDDKMREIKSVNPYLDTTRLAVLTAINVMDEYVKLKDDTAQKNEDELNEES